ncbi:DNA circularization protein [Cupriavidus basilensis]|uniref:DNA circularization protein n=1 Tax=Cupriavidus basilensis TaxID=68895 RepID=UPI0039F6CC0A
MAWKDDLLEASFRGVKFDCVRTRDRLPKELARDAYPYVDGEDIEDLGFGAREIQITATFFGDDYKVRLDAFLGALATRGVGELIHPVFGSIPNAQLVDLDVGHDAENPDACTVELQFLRATPGNPFFVQSLPNQRADGAIQAAEAARGKGSEVFAQALDKLRALKGAYGRLNALRGILSGTLGPIYNLVTGFTRTTLDFLNFPRAFNSDLVGLIKGMGDLRSFDTGVLFSDWKGMLGQYQDVVKLPAQASASQSVIGASGIAQSTDVAKVTAMVQLATATELASIAADVLAAETQTPTLAHTEIEQIANDTRGAIEVAVASYREAYGVEDARPVIESLKDVALAVQTIAIEAIDARPPIVTRTVEAPGNLSLIAHHWYADHTRATELLRLNPSIHNPNFIGRGEVLRAYAS